MTRPDPMDDDAPSMLANRWFWLSLLGYLAVVAVVSAAAVWLARIAP